MTSTEVVKTVTEAKKGITKRAVPAMTNILTVERYKRSQRLHHWVHVFGMLTFFFTGFELFIKVYFVGDYILTRTFHYAFGIFIGVWDLVFFLAIAIKHKKLHEIIPTPRDFLDMFIILLCSLKILPDSKYPHYDYYLIDDKKYVMKYHPAQKLLAVTNLVVIFFMGATGIVLAEELAPGSTLILSVLALAIVPFQILAIDIRFIHFMLYVYFIMTTMIHFYFAIIPQNRNRLRGMVTGKEHIPISE